MIVELAAACFGVMFLQKTVYTVYSYPLQTGMAQDERIISIGILIALSISSLLCLLTAITIAFAVVFKLLRYSKKNIQHTKMEEEDFKETMDVETTAINMVNKEGGSNSSSPRTWKLNLVRELGIEEEGFTNTKRTTCILFTLQGVLGLFYIGLLASLWWLLDSVEIYANVLGSALCITSCACTYYLQKNIKANGVNTTSAYLALGLVFMEVLIFALLSTALFCCIINRIVYYMASILYSVLTYCQAFLCLAGMFVSAVAGYNLFDIITFRSVMKMRQNYNSNLKNTEEGDACLTN